VTDFFRFPRTPHLGWLGTGEPRDDKVLTPAEVRELLSRDVVVEEKVDGANIGISVAPEGVLRVQNRGSFLDLASPPPQFRPLRHWLAVRQAPLTDALGSGLLLFGEWCYAKHSIHYTRLPDWFIAFDVYDRSAQRFWSAGRRDTFARSLALSVVPCIATGRFDFPAVERLLGPSCFADGPAEGVYVRRDAGDFLDSRAKLVRREFTQAIDSHWSRGPLEPNCLLVPGRAWTHRVDEM
jgi:hypothetical protein